MLQLNGIGGGAQRTSIAVLHDGADLPSYARAWRPAGPRQESRMPVSLSAASSSQFLPPDGLPSAWYVLAMLVVHVT
jgi:hypothetical protein